MDAVVKGISIAGANTEKAKALQAALAQIEKQFGKGTIMRLGEGEALEDIQVVSTGSLTLTPQPPPVVSVQVDEFYHPGLRHYFITADAAEKQNLDTGVHSGWLRTGHSFKAYAAGSNPSDSINPVCRYYSPPLICYEGQGCDVGTDRSHR